MVFQREVSKIFFTEEVSDIFFTEEVSDIFLQRKYLTYFFTEEVSDLISSCSCPVLSSLSRVSPRRSLGLAADVASWSLLLPLVVFVPALLVTKVREEGPSRRAGKDKEDDRDARP